MDSQTQTNYTDSQQAVNLKQWAVQEIQLERKNRLLDLLAALPIIQELQSLNIDLKGISLLEIEELCKIAEVDVDSINNTRAKAQLFAFKDSLRLEGNTIFTEVQNIESMILHGCTDYQQLLCKMANVLNDFSYRSGHMFSSYLEQTHADKEVIGVVDEYIHFQNRAIKDTLFCQEKIIKVIKAECAKKGHIFWESNHFTSYKKGRSYSVCKGDTVNSKAVQAKLESTCRAYYWRKGSTI